MESQPSFLSNLSKGISMRIKRIISPSKKFRLNPIHKTYLKHVPSNKIHTTKLFGKTFYYRGGPDFLMGVEEIFSHEIYKQSLPENAVILDCGAHIGMSVIYLKRLCPTAELTAFEPDKKNFEILSKNVASFGFEKVTILNKVVWDNDTKLNFYSEGNMSSRVEENMINAESIEACRLYNFLDRHIDFLKMDIEGAEYRVLKDIEPRLKNVDKIFIEYHGTFNENNEFIEMLQILNRQGFEFYLKEAGEVYVQPFTGVRSPAIYDLQINLFGIRKNKLQ